MFSFLQAKEMIAGIADGLKKAALTDPENEGEFPCNRVIRVLRGNLASKTSGKQESSYVLFLFMSESAELKEKVEQEVLLYIKNVMQEDQTVNRTLLP